MGRGVEAHPLDLSLTRSECEQPPVLAPEANQVSNSGLDMRVVSLSLGGTAAILSVICGVWLMVSPGSAMGVFSGLTHYGLEWKVVPVTVESIVYVAVLWFAAGATAGALFTALYNACAKHCGYK